MSCILATDEIGQTMKAIPPEEKQKLENRVLHDNEAFCTENNCEELEICTNLKSSNGSMLQVTNEKEMGNRSVVNVSVLKKLIDSKVSPKSSNLERKFNCTNNETELSLIKESNACLNISTYINLSNEIGNNVKQMMGVDAERLNTEPTPKVFPEKIELHVLENIDINTENKVSPKSDAIIPDTLSCKVCSELCNINTENLGCDCKFTSDSVYLQNGHKNVIQLQTLDTIELPNCTLTDMKIQSYEYEMQDLTDTSKSDLNIILTKTGVSLPLNAISDIGAAPGVEHDKLATMDDLSSEASNEKNVKLNIHTVNTEKLNCTVKPESNTVEDSKPEVFVIQNVVPVLSGSDQKVCQESKSVSATNSEVNEKLLITPTFTISTPISKKNDEYLAPKIDSMLGIKDEKLLSAIPSANAVPLKINADKTAINDALEIKVEESLNTITSVNIFSTCANKIDCKIKSEVNEKSLSTSSSVNDLLIPETNDNNGLNSKTKDMLRIKDEESVNPTSSVDAVPLRTYADNFSKVEAKKSLSKTLSKVAATSSVGNTSGIRTDTQKQITAATISENEISPTDLYALEKSDIEDPEWDKVKKLTSDEERYKQVRECWNSQTVPNPNKNLTYHSYRKKRLKAGKLDVRVIKQHKRQASESAERPRKHARKCTYSVDNKINSIKSERISKTKSLRDEMNQCIKNLGSDFSYQECKLKEKYNGYQFNYYHDYDKYYMNDLNFLQQQYEQDLYNITHKYENKIKTCTAQCKSRIAALNEAHDEILQFCNFYQGLQKDNPTVLTDTQIQEIEEIDNVYEHFKKYYK